MSAERSTKLHPADIPSFEPGSMVPSRTELATVISDSTGGRSLIRSSLHAAMSLGLTLTIGFAAWSLVPFTWTYAPIWLIYALTCGTVATGVWVVAHECGHRAFCAGTRLQDTIGFVLHTALLVPYFSWQRSHAIHHAKTNHLTDGETHVPQADERNSSNSTTKAPQRGWRWPGAVMSLAAHLALGWPLYLLTGVTGGPSRGVTNHFWPRAPFSQSLFPDRWLRKVLFSAAAVVAMHILLLWLAFGVSSFWRVMALYGAPLLVVNAWVVAYTWMQHTDIDVPHYDLDEWSFVRGAFCTVDRPYGAVADFLHHRIGSTHVAHHLDPKVPHYRAKAATEAIAATYPHLYRYDSTPAFKVLWRVARDCRVVSKTSDGWRFDVRG